TGSLPWTSSTRLDDVAILQDSQSRTAAPPQLRALSSNGCVRTTLPRPSGTRNIMRPMPVVTPNRHGSPLTTPACAPAAVSMTLLGPGVTAATTANRRNATTCSAVIYCLHERGPSCGPLSSLRVMPLKQTRSAGVGLERSCQGAGGDWIAS